MTKPRKSAITSGEPLRSSRKQPSAISARQLAVEHLNRIEVGGAYVGLVGGDLSAEIDPRVERQATEYVAGVTRWRRWLDFFI